MFLSPSLLLNKEILDLGSTCDLSSSDLPQLDIVGCSLRETHTFISLPHDDQGSIERALRFALSDLVKVVIAHGSVLAVPRRSWVERILWWKMENVTSDGLRE